MKQWNEKSACGKICDATREQHEMTTSIKKKRNEQKSSAQMNEEYKERERKKSTQTHPSTRRKYEKKIAK